MMTKQPKCVFCGKSGKRSMIFADEVDLWCHQDCLKKCIDKKSQEKSRPSLISAVKEIRMKMDKNDDFNAGMLTAVLIVEECVGDIKDD